MSPGMLEDAIDKTKARKREMERRMREIFGNGNTPDKQERVQEDKEDNQDTRRK